MRRDRRARVRGLVGWLVVPVRWLAVLGAAAGLGGCGATFAGARARAAGGRPQVVAAENFWGSIAAQLGGDRVGVRSIVVASDVDPHAYEPTTADAVAMAGARLAIVNGIGYDRWASQLLAASPSGGRVVLNVGDVLGLREGDNPHQWYSPASVQRVIDRIVAGYKRIDPAGSAYFDRRRASFEDHALAGYRAAVAEIRARYGGVAVGYSESIFEPLGRALGLDLLTPAGFARAVAEGTDVSAGDRRTVEQQAERRQIAVWVYNSQNATPEVQRVNALARAAGVPLATVTETLTPPTASFEQWQVRQLAGLLRALHASTGR